MRLTGLILLHNVTSYIPLLLWPSQLGISTKGACEVANLTTFLLYELLPIIRSNPFQSTRLSHFKNRPHIYTLLIDLTNCFGLINLSVFTKILNSHKQLESLAPYFALFYGSQSHMFFSYSSMKKLLMTDDVAPNGFFQGEIIASLGSCLVLTEIINLATASFTIEESEILTISSIIDDITVHAHADLLEKFVFNFNKQLLNFKTGYINLSKTILLPPTDSPSCPHISQYHLLAHRITTAINPQANLSDSINVKPSISLGIPHGNQEFIIQHLHNSAIDINKMFSRINQYPHTQVQYHFIKLCMSGLPTSTMRQVRPSLVLPHLVASFQKDTMNWLQQTSAQSAHIPNIIPLNDVSILIAATRCSEGGLNLPLNLENIAPLAYLTATLSNCNTIRKIYNNANNHIINALLDEFLGLPIDAADQYIIESCNEKIDLLKALQKFSEITGLYDHTLETVSSMDNLSQAMASTALSRNNKKKIFSLLQNDENKAQFRSQTSAGAACVFMALPTDKQFTLSTDEFSMLISTRIFAFPDPIGYPHPSQYPLLSTQQLTFECPFCRFRGGTLTYEHILVCPGSGGNIKRHNEGIVIFQQLLDFAGVHHSLREPKSISQGTRRRTDIITSHNQMRRGYDWAVISPNVPTYCKKAALEALHAADSKYKEKLDKHFQAYALENADFVPLILESTGAFHPRTLREIQALVTLSDQQQPVHHSFTIRNSFQFWTHTISIAAVRATMRKQIDARSYARHKVAHILKDNQLPINYAHPVSPLNATQLSTVCEFTNCSTANPLPIHPQSNITRTGCHLRF